MRRNIHLETKLNEPSEAALALPFYPMLPKTKVGLLKWRIYARERAATDLEFRDALWQACSMDVCFFAATFIFLHETRPIPGQPLGKFPFAPDCDQVDLLAWLAKYIGSVDITVSKTRGIGLSYLMCIILLWLWLFNGERIEYALVSKDESSLDLVGRPSSLMGKLDTMFEELPAWMKYNDEGKTILERTQTKHRFTNARNQNSIIGFVPTDDKLRSGRYYCVFLDEAAFLPADVKRWMAAAHGTSNSICWVSTFNGTADMFFRLTQDANPLINVVRIETWFWANPRWAAGLYRSLNGKIEILDPDYRYPSDYVFSHDEPGLLRSPMVDNAFTRPGADAQQVKEEIYGVAVQHNRKLLRPDILNKAKYTARLPIMRGTLDIDGEWADDDLDGEWFLWRPWGMSGGPYSLGIDPAMGVLGAAYAAISVIDCKTGEEVLSAQLAGCEPIRLAQLAVAAAKKIAGPRGSGYCRINWETTGVGVSVTHEIARLRWPALYHDGDKETPGVHNSDRGEAWLIELGRAINDNEMVVRNKITAEELGHFEYDRLYELVYAGTVGHGDLAISLAIAWVGAKKHRKAILDTQKSRSEVSNELQEWEQARQSDLYSDKFSL